MEDIRETGIRWVSAARGATTEQDACSSGLARGELGSFLERFGYEWEDVARADWLAAAVLSELGDGLRIYVERSGGDLRDELAAADAEAEAAMDSAAPTEASLRHDLRHVGYRPPAGYTDP